MAQQRERIISSRGNRFVRRDSRGRFTSDQVRIGASLSRDRQQRAKTTVRSGQGDKGDQRR